MTRKTHQRTTRRSRSSNKKVPITFLDHVHELQVRLGWIVVAFLIATSVAYPFFNTIVGFLVRPLGPKNQLVYLSPSGAFGFVMQVCLYVGIIGALPVILYHAYQFVMPAVTRVERKKVILYTFFSFVLALTGVSFAYYIVLPSALYFLTSFNLYHINPMLTIDSYLSFVMAYIITGAVLFQLPLILLVINTITPLKPSKLMGAQGYIILAAFIFGAIASPTPDVVNQTLLAVPIVAMYQLGIVLIWLKNRKLQKRGRAKQLAQSGEDLGGFDDIIAAFSSPQPQQSMAPSVVAVPAVTQPVRGRSLDGVRIPPRQVRPVVRPAARPQVAGPPTRHIGRSIDGVSA